MLELKDLSYQVEGESGQGLDILDKVSSRWGTIS